MKGSYETVVVYDGTLPEETLQKEQDELKAFLEENGEFEKVDVWGRRNLAYEIRKRKVGYYCLFLYNGEGGLTGKLEDQLRLNENVLRHLSVRRKRGAGAPAQAQPGEGKGSAVGGNDDDKRDNS